MRSSRFPYATSVIGALIIVAIGITWISSQSANEHEEIITTSPLIENNIHPTQLIIPKLAIHTNIESVGLDSAGNMEVPHKAEEVAWYNGGSLPGNNGNAVIAGHLDSTEGPAVFYNLSTLIKGDEIIITNGKGEKQTFIVTENISYPTFHLPLEKLFGETKEPYLHLVTCSGKFNATTQLYSHRTLVTAIPNNFTAASNQH